MTLLAVPNISEGRDHALIAGCADAVTSAGAKLLDVHSDEVHNRTVLTLAGGEAELVAGCAALARAALTIDLRHHRGVHPRLGVLDVSPFVPHAQTSLEDAVRAAREAGRRIGAEAGLPVFFYGAAATRPETRDLPALRRGGLAGLTERVDRGLVPDEGPHRVDPRSGAVCVGARGPLIAFNVWLDCDVPLAKQIAGEIRSSNVRALGLRIAPAVAQVSMNLIDPVTTGIEAAFAEVEARAMALGIHIRATEIVGLVERRFLAGPETTAARLLLEPGRTVEDALKRVG